MASFDALAAGSEIHRVRHIDEQTIEISPQPESSVEFDSLVDELRDDVRRDYAIFPRLGDDRRYSSAEIARL